MQNQSNGSPKQFTRSIVMSVILSPRFVEDKKHRRVKSRIS